MSAQPTDPPETDLSPNGGAPAPPLGDPVRDWHPPAFPARATVEGRTCRVEPLDPTRHGDDLFAANAQDRAGALWRYMSYGPFEDPAAYRIWLEAASATADPQFYAVVDAATGRAAGVASLMRIDPANGAIEVGHICFSPLLQRRVAATEAMALLMGRAFGLGYRRYEWKCNALNAASRRAAQRLGFSFEGVFRQATVSKGRNRDTAWYAVIDGEWPALGAAFDRWLDPKNFDAAGRQRVALSDLTRPLLAAVG